MKKLILSACSFLITSCVLMAQSSLLVTDLNNGSVVIPNGSVLFESEVANGLNQLDYNIKNISSSVKVYKMRMYYDLRHVVAPGDSAEPYFCFGGTCYSVNTLIAIQSQTLLANQDVSSLNKLINIHYDEASAAGLSIIRYRIYDVANPNTDFFEFTIRYNDPAVSVKNISSQFTSVSDVYPNPSANKANLNISSISEVETTISICNTLGSVVSVKKIELTVGKNNIPLDIENLNTGIYFVTISSGNSKIVKKFTINK